MFYIYTIQNKHNNKIYVGKSSDPEDRWNKHIIYAKGGKEKYPSHFQYLHTSIAKHGVDQFTLQIIEEFENEIDCFEAEQFWIQFFRSWSKDYGYNLTIGGEGASGRIVSEETKNKIRIKAVGRLHSEEVKAKISEAGRLRTNSPETRIKISNSNKGRKTTKEQTAANSLRQRGELSPNAKFTYIQAVEIRELLKIYTVTAIAKMYNVSNSTISHIKNNRTYKEVK